MYRFLCLIPVVLLVFLPIVAEAQTPLRPRNGLTAGSAEVMAARSSHSRTFRQAGGVTTTALASWPLHYRDADGQWQSLTYRLSPSAHGYDYPREAPRYGLDDRQGAWLLQGPDGEPWLTAHTRGLRQTDPSGAEIGRQEAVPGKWTPDEVGDRAILREVLPGVDLEARFDPHYLKTGYLLQGCELVLPAAEKWIIEERVTVPAGYRLRLMGDGNASGQRLALYDPRGERIATLARPMLRDSRFEAWSAEVAAGGRPPAGDPARLRESGILHATYILQEQGPGDYMLGIAVPSAWLRDPGRVYPVWVDPIITLEDLTPLETCFYPAFSTGAMSIAIPEGDTIVSTYFEWDFTTVAATQGWIEDQRTYISGPLGQTQEFLGVIADPGVETYRINTDILNVRSEGEVEFSFHAARVWGGDDCGLEFNFISRRYVEVIHTEEIVFGEGRIVVNEYSASNRGIPDDFNQLEDWIELYNDSDNFVSLEGYRFSDDPTIPGKWRSPGGFLFPRGHQVVICSGRDTLAGFTPHTNFRLSQLRPEHILFSAPDGTVIDSMVLWRTQNGHSYGRMQDGGDTWGVFAQPTFGQSNTNGFDGYTPMPILSPAPGFYDEPVEVMIEADLGEGMEIRYTIDGRVPDAGSTLYTGPFSVAATQVVRARVFRSGTDPALLPGFLATGSYFIREPHQLPVFSFSGNQVGNLFNGSQLRITGAVEYFGTDGRFIDGTFCEFNKHGNDSWAYPQRGVDFIARDEFGYKEVLEHRFFQTTPRERFQRLMVKAAANDNYPHEEGGAHIRDVYIQHLSQVSALDLDERSAAFCALYVNGQYWGLYDLRERVDDNDYTDFYYNQDRRFKGSEEYLQYLKTWGATRPEYGEQKAMNDWTALRQFVAQNSMAPGPAFGEVEAQLNIGSMIDYFVINSFVVSRDWLNYNTGWWRGTNPQGEARKWRYTLWDMDGALGHYINWTGLGNVTETAPPCQVDTLPVGNGHVAILAKLIAQNPEVRRQYVLRYADLLNTHFSYERLSFLLDSLVAVFAPEMPEQIARWGGDLAEWAENVETMRHWIEGRCIFLEQGLMDCYDLSGPYRVEIDVQPPGTGRVLMNSEWLPQYPFQATMYGNIESRFTAAANDSYVFSHWELEGMDGKDLSDPHLRDSLSGDARLVAHFTDANLGDRELLYYWHFNTLNTPGADVTAILADYSYLPEVDAFMTYTGTGPRDIDHFNTGSDLNLLVGQGAGRAARVRNPSQDRSLVFNMPTDGMENLRFEYAVQRSGQGMLLNLIAYSLDGEQYTQEGLVTVAHPVSEEYALITVDLGHIAGVNDNPDFHLRIEFQGNTTTGNGNNRFDNISLKGQAMPTSIRPVPSPRAMQWAIFPNPSMGMLLVERKGPQEFRRAWISDLSGRVMPLDIRLPGRVNELDVRTLAPGLYFLHIEDDLGGEVLPFVRG